MHAEGWSITVRARGDAHVLHAQPRASLGDLQVQVHEATRVRPERQKWFVPRRATEAVCGRQNWATLLEHDTAQRTPVADAGLWDGAVVTVVGPTDAEFDGLRQREKQWAKENAPRQLHPSMLRDARPRSTATVRAAPVFAQCAVHPETPSNAPLYDAVMSCLQRLAHDPAVLHVCRSHGYTVGTLSELLPHEHANLLGLNENRGERISLRIRTDAGDGTRDYKTTRRVLLHELAHNTISDHPPAFKILNSQLNAEVSAYERDVARGSHSLRTGPAYEPRARASTDSGSYVLGGSERGAGAAADLLEERRERVLQATEARLARLDEEISARCSEHEGVDGRGEGEGSGDASRCGRETQFSQGG
ncbi:hypothetical protein MSPP1_002904 [Malassezia sp. CBS 17886]|nr:hypothetical protein MSPP1_002904 [Malassezia sp. CBS 17886]